MPRQLWEPFRSISLSEDLSEENDCDVEGCSYPALPNALSAFYARFFSEAGLVVSGDIHFDLAKRAWVDYKFVVTSMHYAKSNRETTRAGYYVFFRSSYLDRLRQSRKGWYVGKVLFFMEHFYRGRTFFLACVDVMKSIGVRSYYNIISIVQYNEAAILHR